MPETILVILIVVAAGGFLARRIILALSRPDQAGCHSCHSHPKGSKTEGNTGCGSHSATSPAPVVTLDPEISRTSSNG